MKVKHQSSEKTPHLDSIEAIANAASPGEWKISEYWGLDAEEVDEIIPGAGPVVGIVDGNGEKVCGTCDDCYIISPANAQFIVNARTAVPALVSEVRELKKLLKAALLHAQEYSDGCLFCGADEIVDGEITAEHRAACWYYKALGILEGKEKP